MEHFEKIIYLLSLFFPIILFFLFGLFTAWLIWRNSNEEAAAFAAENNRIAQQIQTLNQENNQLYLKVSATKSSDLNKKDTKIAELQKKIESLNADLAECNKKRTLVESPSSRSKPLEGVTQELFESSETCLPSGIIEDLERDASVEKDEEFGFLYKERPKVVDNLKRIKGVGIVLEKKLNEIGVYRFNQIVHWQPNQIKKFNETLSFPGRVERDNWLEQAQQFHEEKHSS